MGKVPDSNSPFSQEYCHFILTPRHEGAKHHLR